MVECLRKHIMMRENPFRELRWMQHDGPELMKTVLRTSYYVSQLTDYFYCVFLRSTQYVVLQPAINRGINIKIYGNSK